MTGFFDRRSYSECLLALWLTERKALPSETSRGNTAVVAVTWHLWFFWLLSHLPRVGEKWTGGQYFHKLVVLTICRAFASDRCLSNMPVVGTRLEKVVSENLRVNSGET